MTKNISFFIDHLTIVILHKQEQSQELVKSVLLVEVSSLDFVVFHFFFELIDFRLEVSLHASPIRDFT